MCQHAPMTEIKVIFRGDSDASDTQRAVCRYCWHEGPDGEQRREDWPCPTARAQEAVVLLNSMIASGESHSETSRAVVRRALAEHQAGEGGGGA